MDELTFRMTDTPSAEELVFALLLDNANEEFTESDVRLALGLPRTTAHTALVALRGQGVLTSREIGRSRLYAIDTSDPLIEHLKVARAIRRTRVVLAPVQDLVESAVLFGSSAKGQDRRASDTDLLVIADDVDAVEAELAQHQWLQPVVMDSARHMQLLAEGGTFAMEVSSGITVWRRA